MPTLSRVSWRTFAIPLEQEFGAAHGTTTLREGVLLRIETDEGFSGLGEASPLPSFVPGTVTDVLARMPEQAAALFDGDPFDGLLHGLAPDAAEQALPGAVGARTFAFQVALGSIAAEAAGLPFFRWFAERNVDPRLRRTVAPSPVVPVNAVIGGLEPEMAGQLATTLLAAGYRVFKVKVGMDLESDIARAKAVRAAIGDASELRIDANGGWTIEQAATALRRLIAANISILEQPFRPGKGEFESFADLGMQFPEVTIAADESLQTADDMFAWHSFAEMDEPRLGTVFKPMVAGVSEFRSMFALADAGKPVIVTTTIDAGIATAAAMHLAACLPAPRAACGLSTLAMLEGDIVTGVPPVLDGMVTIPETPGLGVALDEASLEKYATGPWQEYRR